MTPQFEIDERVHAGPLRDPSALFDLKRSSLLAAVICALMVSVIAPLFGETIRPIAVVCPFVLLGALPLGSVVFDYFARNTITPDDLSISNGLRGRLCGSQLEIIRVLKLANSTMIPGPILRTGIRGDLLIPLIAALSFITVIWRPILNGTTTTWSAIILGGWFVAILHGIANRAVYRFEPGVLIIRSSRLVGLGQELVINLIDSEIDCDFARGFVKIKNAMGNYFICLDDFGRPHYFAACILSCVMDIRRKNAERRL